MIEKFCFDTYLNKNYYGYRLSNDFLEVVILEYGGIIQSFINKETAKDIVLGYLNIEDYINDKNNYFGAVVGRFSNRIDNGEYYFNDILYKLERNNFPHHLHGGEVGFNQKIFQAEIINDKLELTYLSKDLESGYSGDLTLKVTYYLKESSLVFSFQVFSELGSIFNITQHSYFNLNGPIKNHYLKVNSDFVAYNDKYNLALTPALPVLNSIFDLKKKALIQDILENNHEQLINAHGLDHFYLKKEKGLTQMVELSFNKLKLTLETDLPGVHIHTGNYINNIFGKDYYNRQSGICFETQYYPNNINNDALPKSILKPFQKIKHTTIYTLKGE